MDIEHKYLCISIILLIISYYFVKFTKNNLDYISNINDANDNKFNKTIKFKKNNKYEELDSNLFEMYINKLKISLIKLSSNITNKECQDLKKYLDKSKVILSREIENIKDNSKKYDKDFCKDEFNRLIDLNIVEYRKKLIKENNISNINKIDNLKEEIIDILIDMEIISYIIRNTSCKKNKIDISYIDVLLHQLYNTKCNSIDNTIEQFVSNDFELPIYNSISEQNSINISNANTIDNTKSDAKNKNNKMGILEDVKDAIKYTSYANHPSSIKYMPHFIIDPKNNPVKQDYSSKNCISHFKDNEFNDNIINESVKEITALHNITKNSGVKKLNDYKHWDPRDFTHVDKSAKCSLFS